MRLLSGSPGAIFIIRKFSSVIANNIGTNIAIRRTM